MAVAGTSAALLQPANLEYPPLCTLVGDEWVYHLGLLTDDEITERCAGELARCIESVEYFASHYCCTENAHLDDEYGRPPEVNLIPTGVSPITGKEWGFVSAFFDAWEDVGDTLVEKTRDMMCSWLAMAGTLHDVMFRPNWAVMTLSRVETLVDDGGETSTTDSLHGKIRFMYTRLPMFLQKASPLEFTNLSVNNPRYHSHVTGFSATPHAGRGPKWKRAVLDEFAWVPWSEQVMASVARACPRGKYLISTPNGKANAFYRVREIARSIWPQRDRKKANWRRLTIHWRQHPERDATWHQKQVTGGSMTEEAVAQELDINYAKSVGRRVYPRFVREQHVSGSSLCSLVEMPYDPKRALNICWDFNPDPLLVEIVQCHAIPPLFRVIGEICRRNATFEDACFEFIVRFGARPVVDKLLSENPGYEAAYGQNGICLAGSDGHTGALMIYGDATEEKSTVYSKVKIYQRIKGLLRDHGFNPIMRVPLSNPPIRHRIETVNDVFSKDLAVMTPYVEELAKDLEQGHWDTVGKDMAQSKDDDGSNLTRSHASSAFGYMMVCVHKIGSTAVPVTRANKRSIRDQFPPEFVRNW